MAIKIGSDSVSALYVGTNAISKVYLGSDLIAVTGGGGGGYAAKAIHFGTDFALNTSSLVAPDTGLLSFSCWTKFAGADGGSIDMFAVDFSGAFTGYFQITSYMLGFLSDFEANNQLRFSSNSVPSIMTGGWMHWLFSCNTNLPAGNKQFKLYVNDVDVTTLEYDGDPAFLMHFATTTFFNLGANEGDSADYWFAPGQSLLVDGEIPVAARRKFISASGKPVNLGADGSVPTGTKPVVFLSGDHNTFGTNLGTGGNLIQSGVLTDATTSPSD